MRYVGKDPNHDSRLTRGADEADQVEPESYSDFLDRRLMAEAELEFPAPFSFSQVLQ
jgi:hypothetical protein